jgi:hypothetical protein
MNHIFNKFLVIILLFFSDNLFGQIITKTYEPTTSRFDNFNEYRKLLVNQKSLFLNPFEMFDIMTFEEVGSGYNTYLKFTIQETKEEFYFDDVNNIFTYNGVFTDDLYWTGNEATVVLECATEENLIRGLQKNRKYKVIYCHFNDSKLSRKPFPTESMDGYYIVDIIEMNDQFEREKQ